MNNRPILTARQRLAWLQQRGQAPTATPTTLILCFHKPLLRWATKGRKARKIRGFYGESYLLRGNGGVVMVGGFGVGAPVTAILVEDWAAHGVTKVVSVGVAGSLQSQLAAGEVALVDAALGADGTSQRYSSQTTPHCASKKLILQLQRSGLQQAVTSWTCDTPYRESWDEVAALQQRGVAVVEMEIAALFAVAQAVEIDAAAVVVVADTLGDDGWMLAPDWPQIEAGLQTAYTRVVEAVS